MRLKTAIEKMEEDVAYGFELAIRYAELAKQYDKDIVEFLKERLKTLND